MQVLESATEMQRWAEGARTADRKIAFVPTMGALHEGHLSLIRHARNRPPSTSVVSIFVNPTQFNQPDDFQEYPRNLEGDLRLCEKEGVDLVFTPTEREIYPDGLKTDIPVPKVALPMEGEFRPGHFAGVCAVVARLFRIVRPHTALFGEKDFQQVRVIEEMVKEQKIPVKIIRCPTVRDQNGLALSSRNARLSADGYKKALAIPGGIVGVQNRLKRHVGAGLKPAPTKPLVDSCREKLSGLKIDYITIANPETLLPVEVLDRPARIFIAAWVEGIRLIDNAPYQGTR